MADLELGDAGRGAIARFQRGNLAAPLAAARAQRIERRIIALGDIAALARIDRRGRHQRALQPLDQLAMAEEGGQHGFEQRRTGRDLIEQAMEPICLIEPVAKLTEIARAAPPRRQPPQSPPDIGQRPQDRPQARAQIAVVVQPSDQIEPVVDHAPIGERRRQIEPEQPRTGAGDGAIERVEQAALAATRARLDDLQALARRGIDHHVIGRSAAYRRGQER